MAKQVTEQYFREAILCMDNIHVDKIQVNPFAFTSTTADYFIQTETSDCMVECKQITIKDKKHVLDIHRLTQEFKLVEWDKRFKRNKSFVFINWWKGSKKNSFAYMVPITAWMKFRKTYKKSTIGLEDFSFTFGGYICPLLNDKYYILDFD